MRLGARQVRLAILAAGAAALAAITVRAGMEPVLRSLAALKLSGLAIIILLHLPVIGLMGLAWWCIGRETAARPGPFVAARLARDSIAEVLPFSQLGGFVGGVRLLVLAGSRTLDASLTLFADLVAEFSAKLLYTLAGLLVLAWLLPHAGLIRPFSLALAGAFLIFGLLLLLRRRFRTGLNRLAHWGLRKYMPQPPSEDSERDLSRVFSPGHFLPSFAIHAVCWLFGAAEAWVTLHLMGVSVNTGQALVIDCLATAFRTLGFLVPGALGIQEAGYVLVCALFGLTPASAIAFSLARRARDIVIGLAGLGLWQTLEVRRAAVQYRQSGSAKL
jgi:putative membrane protein